jgi:hypothetical protein
MMIIILEVLIAIMSIGVFLVSAFLFGKAERERTVYIILDEKEMRRESRYMFAATLSMIFPLIMTAFCLAFFMDNGHIAAGIISVIICWAMSCFLPVIITKLHYAIVNRRIYKIPDGRSYFDMTPVNDPSLMDKWYQEEAFEFSDLEHPESLDLFLNFLVGSGLLKEPRRVSLYTYTRDQFLDKYPFYGSEDYRIRDSVYGVVPFADLGCTEEDVIRAMDKYPYPGGFTIFSDKVNGTTSCHGGYKFLYEQFLPEFRVFNEKSKPRILPY